MIAALVSAALALVICFRALGGERRWQRRQQGDRKAPRPARPTEPDDPNRPRGPWDSRS
jgi:hypothetical protein